MEAIKETAQTSLISLIIPAYNEAVLLPRLLASVERARKVFADSGGNLEVIVADNCSTDATSQIAFERGCQVVTVEKRCIAAVRNAGAKSAKGEILAFIDADFVIHEKTFVHLREILNNKKYVGGATGVTLERWSFGILVTYLLLLPFILLTKMDTGVVFCRRADFEEIGGYDEDLQFAEDIALLLTLRRLGKMRGQRLIRATEVKAVASTRKFDEHGDWHYFTLLWRLSASIIFRGDGEKFADRYWYKPNR
jgi:glycosyltransferase involved in cell wall biosynthesis